MDKRTLLSDILYRVYVEVTHHHPFNIVFEVNILQCIANREVGLINCMTRFDLNTYRLLQLGGLCDIFITRDLC
jgi:hypothetical protein